MSVRLAARLFVDALRRRAEGSGGEAIILARGDPTSGTVLIVHVARDGAERAWERSPGFLGPIAWEPVGPADGDPAAIATYVERRRKSDPDLWVVEITGDDAMLASACEMTGGD